jgi:hypothetical protein
MSASTSYPEQVKLLRSWGFTVKEQPGCYGRSNGTSWHGGDRAGQVNHHYVCPLAPPANPQPFVDSLTNGKTVNWVIDAAGVIYLCGTGPMNHAGKGDSSVLARIKAGQAPTGWHPPKNDYTGNQDLDGVELLHPGDSSPYPDAMIDATVALNASRCIVLGQSPNTSIMHGEHTNRKIDMSWLGGPGGPGGVELRKRVAARVSGGGSSGTTPVPPTQGEEDMTPYTEAQMKSFAEAGARSFAATQEFRDRVMQACNESLSRNASTATAQAKAGSTQFGATQEFKDRVMVACQEALKRAGIG